MKKFIPIVIAAGVLVSLTACGTTVADQINNCTTRTLAQAYRTNPELYSLTSDEKSAMEQKITNKCLDDQKADPYGFQYKYSR